MWADEHLNAAAWMLGWRVANEGLRLPHGDRDFMALLPHFKAGKQHEGGTRREAEELARAMGRVPEEEL